MGLDDTVVAFRRADLPLTWLEARCCVAMDKLEFAKAINAVSPVLLSRRDAEYDSAYKQPIPYIVIRDSENRLACFPRHSSEVRLHGLWSLGVGGHVDSTDVKDDNYTTLEACAYRELAEETCGCDCHNLSLRFAGIINEKITSVGHTHFGCVFTLQLSKEQILTPASELTGMVWRSHDDLTGIRLELWSCLAMELLGM